MHNRKPEPKMRHEAEVSANKSSIVRMPIHKYVVGKTKGPYKSGIKSARLPIVTFPLIALGHVVFLKRLFRSIRTLHVLTPGLGPLQQPAEVDYLTGKAAAKEKAQASDEVEYLTVKDAAKERVQAFGEEKGKSQATAKGVEGTKKSLHDFAAEGNNDALRAALQEPSVKVNEPDLLGRTALYWAAAKGQADTVDFLLMNNANPNLRSSNTDRTPLWWAAGNGHFRIVILLLKNNAKPNISDNQKQSPLHWAVRRRHTTIVERLVEYGADITSRDNDGRTPLSWAAEYGFKNDQLLSAMKFREDPVDATDNRGWTPLHWAAKNGNQDVVNWLLKAGANAQLKDKSGRTPQMLTNETDQILSI